MVKKIQVRGSEITVISKQGQDYISLTDMLKAKDGDFFISDWLRNRNTVEFLGIWESVYNPDFNYGEFALIKSLAGLNSYKLSVKEWVEKTGAIGLQATAGRYGGTYAHKDIAFEFGMWISAEFKIYLIKEFQRLKDEESRTSSLEWNFQRTLAKVNYKIHTDAIKERLIPPRLTQAQTSIIYASEADVLNVALFGMTAAQWRLANVEQSGNMRDAATLEQLVVLSNLESINAVLIHQGLLASARLEQLNAIAITQMRSLVGLGLLKDIAGQMAPKKLPKGGSNA
jgi:KilA-N domain